jgi:hypothetical protein
MAPKRSTRPTRPNVPVRDYEPPLASAMSATSALKL